MVAQVVPRRENQHGVHTVNLKRSAPCRVPSTTCLQLFVAILWPQPRSSDRPTSVCHSRSKVSISWGRFFAPLHYSSKLFRRHWSRTKRACEPLKLSLVELTQLFGRVYICRAAFLKHCSVTPSLSPQYTALHGLDQRLLRL